MTTKFRYTPVCLINTRKPYLDTYHLIAIRHPATINDVVKHVMPVNPLEYPVHMMTKVNTPQGAMYKLSESTFQKIKAVKNTPYQQKLVCLYDLETHSQAPKEDLDLVAVDEQQNVYAAMYWVTEFCTDFSDNIDVIRKKEAVEVDGKPLRTDTPVMIEVGVVIISLHNVIKLRRMVNHTH